MHDFIQNLSFSSPVPAPRVASEPLRRLTQSFNDVPAYRPAPRRTARRKSPARSSHKS
jgi:hypothetical protein